MSFKKNYPFQIGEEIVPSEPYIVRRRKTSKFDPGQVLLEFDYLICPRCKSKLDFSTQGVCNDCGVLIIVNNSTLTLSECTDRIMEYRANERKVIETKQQVNELQKQTYQQMLDKINNCVN